MNLKRIAEIQKYGKTAKGRSELIKHFEGQRLSLRQAVYARCYDCTGYFADGKVDCNMPHCPLHPFMAYNENRLKRTNSKSITTKQSAARL